MIQENLAEVEARIADACKRAGRSRDEVTLIAVSKTKPLEDLREAYAYGCRNFGENKVQELCDKIEQMPSDIRWHMIGHLQRNKVKYLIGKTACIHSVDSVRLAEQIETESAKKNVITDILVEVNVAQEESKFGIPLEQAESYVREFAGFPHIRVCGLMTIAPYTVNPEENRQFFSDLRKVYVDIKGKNIDNVNMSILSMGMTNDYEIAIEEGATMVRVGTGIFGERNYTM